MVDATALFRSFDGRTTFLTGALLAGIFAPIMLTNARIRKIYPGYRLWAYAELAFACTFFIQSFRGYIPEIIPIVFGNIASFLAVYLLMLGNYRFTQQKILQWPLILMAAGLYLLLLYYYFAVDSLRMRALLQGSYSVLLLALGALPFLGSPPQGRVFGYRFALVTLLWGFAIGLMRIVSLLRSAEMRTLFSGHPADIGYYISNFLFLLGVTFSFFILVNERYVADLSEEIGERRNLEERLREMIRTDELTHALNRRGLLEELGREVQRAIRLQHTLCILALDLDNLKGINDVYGHQMGDRAIAAFAHACMENLRSIDTFGRSGGDEFIVILPETSLGQALRVAHKLLAEIREITLEDNGRQLSLTASIGVAARPQEDASGFAVMLHADRALYLAKRAGRDCVRWLRADVQQPTPDAPSHPPWFNEIEARKWENDRSLL